MFEGLGKGVFRVSGFGFSAYNIMSKARSIGFRSSSLRFRVDGSGKQPGGLAVQALAPALVPGRALAHVFVLT